MSKEIKNAILSGTPFNIDFDDKFSGGYIFTYYLNKHEDNTYSLQRKDRSAKYFNYVGNINKITESGVHWFYFFLNKKVAGFIPFKNCILNPQT